MKKWILMPSLLLAFLFTGCASLSKNSTSENSEPPTTSEGSFSENSESPETSETPETSEAPETSETPETSESPNPPTGDEDCAHKDKNSDDECDVCHIPLTVTLDFYSINDMHGKFDDTYANIGVDEMSAYLRNAQTVSENTIILSAGDMWQGSAESNFTQGNVVVEWMNDLGFVAMAMGNHEYDWGSTPIEANAELAEFPFLGINIFERNTNQRVDYCQPSVMVERSGAKIGIIGAIGDCYSSIAAGMADDVYFKVGSELTTLVKNESTRLRGLGADLIVFVVHDGDDNYDSSLSNGYVDLVFEGHTHKEVRKTDSYGVWHLQAGGDNGTGLSHAQVEVNILSDKHTVSTKIVKHSTYQNMQDDPIVDEILEKYSDKLTAINTTLGTNDSYRNSDAIVEATAEAMYIKGAEKWGNNSKYQGKIVLGGGFLQARSPYYLPAKEVTYGDIYPLLPFDNPLVLCEVSGSRLKSQFINSSNYVCFYGEDGQAIKNNVSNNETYYVVVDTYCANYNFSGLGFLKIVEYYEDGDHSYYPRHALAEYIYNGGWRVQAEEKTIPEILAIGKGLASGAQTSERYRVTGKIVKIENSSSGIFYIEDTSGNQLYVYRTYDTNGNPFGSMSYVPKVGDTVTLESVIKKYYSTIEFFDATIKSVSKQ